MNHPLRCRCGTIKGFVAHPEVASRALCYCKDCQAYTHFLERADVLDEHGGTMIVATLPEHVHLTQGQASLASLSLSEKGMLRWYASCCNTPIGNTPRDVKTPYIGLLDCCLSQGKQTVAQSFGPVRAILKPKSASGPVKATPLRNLAAIARLMKTVISGRIAGAHKRNPFFKPGTAVPIVQPRVLTLDERQRATPA